MNPRLTSPKWLPIIVVMVVGGLTVGLWQRLVPELQSSVPTITLVVGLLVAFILAWTVRLTLVARNRSKTMEGVSQRLQREIAERISAENALSAALEKE